MRVLLLSWFFLVGSAYAAPVEITLQSAEGLITLKMDDSRIDVVALKRYLVVHPIPHDGDFDTYVYLPLCVEHDPMYKPCGTRDIHAKYFLENAAYNLQMAEQRLAYLNGLHEFRELQPLVDYFRSSLEFSIWIGKRLFEYFKTWNPAALEQDFKGLPVSTKAKAVLDRLKNASDIESRWDLSYYEWHRIANSLYRDAEGPVPSDVWEKFIRERRIVETIEDDNPEGKE